MQLIHSDDPAWLSTFPHLVEPHQDECLPSLLLRCDEANGWTSGTTLAHLRRESHFKQATLLQDLIVPSQLEMLAPLHVWLELPCNSIEATTYHRELASCYEKKRPCFSYLHSSFTFQLCPDFLPISCCQVGASLSLQNAVAPVFFTGAPFYLSPLWIELGTASSTAC